MTHDSPPSTHWRAWAFVAMVGAVALATCRGPQALHNWQAEKASKERYAKAKALFEERCKTAGVVIHRTVKDVEGIELTKVRPKLDWADKRYFDPMFEGAAMAGENKGEEYILQFLVSETVDSQSQNVRGILRSPHFNAGDKKGYRFVETIDPEDGRLYRFTGRIEQPWLHDKRFGESVRQFNLHRTPIERSTALYALDYEDIVDPADRQHWVAGTRLKVIDKQTGEVIATLTKFLWDPGFGVSTTGRLPWQHASAFSDRKCPPTPLTPTGSESRYFIDTVLIPKQGD